MKRLETIDAQTLLEQPFEKPPWVVEDLISPGLHLLVGAPKVGKSWLVLDLGLHVSEGEPFWGFATCSCDVLYLCLEDTFICIQERLFRLTDEATPHFHFATNSFRIPDGLTAQLDAFLDEHPTTRFIIIDTFQVVRKPTKDNAYAADYSDLGVLKRFADERELAILLLHHTRKATDSDIFNTVSGTTGITGSADSTFILRKENRYDSKVTAAVMESAGAKRKAA